MFTCVVVGMLVAPFTDNDGAKAFEQAINNVTTRREAYFIMIVLES